MTQRIAHLIGIIVVAAISLFSLEAGATCTEPTDNAFVQGIVSEGETYFTQQQMEKLSPPYFTDVIMAVECLGEPIEPQVAASVHRIMAVSSYMARNKEMTLASLASARAAHGDFSYQRALEDTSGHPLELLYNQAADFDAGVPTLPVFAGGYTRVDGARNMPVFAGRPAILQAITVSENPDDDTVHETVVHTVFVEVGEMLPDWARSIQLPTEPLEPVTRNGSGLLKRPGVYYGVAGALLAGGVTSAVISQRAHNAYNDPSTPNGNLAGLESQTNNWGTASAVLLGAAAVPGGLGVTITFTGRNKEKGMSPDTETDLASNP